MCDARQTKTFADSGRIWLRNAIRSAEIDKLSSAWSIGSKPGTRYAGPTPMSRILAQLNVVKKIQRLWPGMRPVRLLSFDKNPDSNWGVPWHQDRIIAVDQKADLPGYRNWSQKQGVWHCEPPESLLRNMLFVRLHLDENTRENGAMDIAVGSHLAGLVPSQDAERTAMQFPNEVTTCAAGDVLILNMLTLHRSTPSQTGGSRRTLRVDFSPDTLPEPLAWAL